VRDALQAVGCVEPAIERVNLVAKPVEALEQGVELPVVEVLSLLRHCS
jgi:hypothetical protein